MEVAKIKVLLLVFFSMRLFLVDAQCNCYTELCQKRYDQVAYLTTHNAFNSQQDNFSFPNQSYSITRQLVDGVRALMIDVYDKDGVPTVYHSTSLLGSHPLSQNLKEIYDFMVNNPKEIVTIIFECYVTAAAIESELNTAGLLSMTFIKTNDSQWPTLQHLIDSGKRLVIFTDKKDASANQKWYHYVWNYAVETSFSVTDTAGLNSSFIRGNASNDLFILNHFLVSKTFGTGVKSKAEIANSNPFFIQRAKKSIAETSKFPNFVTVDFYEVGNCLDVINELNGVVSSIPTNSDLSQIPTLWPNPMKNKATINMPQSSKPPYIYQINNLNGDRVSTVFKQWNYSFQIDRQNLPKGIFLVTISDVKLQNYWVKLVVK